VSDMYIKTDPTNAVLCCSARTIIQDGERIIEVGKESVLLSASEYYNMKAELERNRKDLLKYAEIIHRLIKELEELKGITGRNK